MNLQMGTIWGISEEELIFLGSNKIYGEVGDFTRRNNMGKDLEMRAYNAFLRNS